MLSVTEKILYHTGTRQNHKKISPKKFKSLNDFEKIDYLKKTFFGAQSSDLLENFKKFFFQASDQKSSFFLIQIKAVDGEEGKQFDLN